MAIFTNQATLSYNGRVVNSNITTGQIATALSGAKTALIDQYAPDGTLTYVISLTNSSNADLTDLTVTDNLGAYTFGQTLLYPLSYVEGSLKYYVNGVLQSEPDTTAGPPLAVSGISVPANGNAIIVYQSNVTEFAPLGENGTITNVATVSGESLSAPLTLSETVGSINDSLLSITKSLEPLVVEENGELTYTFVIENSGNISVDALANAVITDIFNPVLRDITVRFNGEVWNEPENYTYNEATGAFATVPGQITVPGATFVQNPVTGVYTSEPGTAVLTVSGRI